MGTINCEVNTGYAVDTAIEAQTAILPATPDDSDQVGFGDYNKTFSINKLTISGNGNLVDGESQIEVKNSGEHVVVTFVVDRWVVTSRYVEPSREIVNRPAIQIQETKPQGTANHAGAAAVGYNKRPLNKVVMNEISGALLSDNELTLPPGTYWIEAETGSMATNSSNTVIKVNGVDRINSIPTYNSGTYGSLGGGIARGKLVLTQTSQISLYTVVQTAQASSWGLGHASFDTADDMVNVFAELWAYKLDEEISTVVISDPETSLAYPLFHAQDQKPSTTPGGDAVAGENQRDLNTALVNEIAGATLESNQITLAAGTYDIAAQSTVHRSSTANKGSRLAVMVDGSPQIISPSTFVYQTEVGGMIYNARGRITLSSQSVITLSTYHEAAYASGLGYPSGQAPHEMYSEITIRQVDVLTRQPILVNDRLFPLPGNAIVTGNIHGFGYAKTGDNEITVQPGICMDSLNETMLTLNTQQVVAPPAAADTIYNLFMCDDGFVRLDTDVDGANLTGRKIRWIGFVLNDSSGILCDFTVNGDNFYPIRQATEVQWRIAAIGTTETVVDFSAHFPVSRVELYKYNAYGSVAAAIYWNNRTSVPGAWMDVDYIQGNSYSPTSPEFNPASPHSMRTSTGTATPQLTYVKMKR